MALILFFYFSSRVAIKLLLSSTTTTNKAASAYHFVTLYASGVLFLVGLWSLLGTCSDSSDVYSSDRRVAAGGSGGAFDPRQADSQQRVSGGLARITHQVLFAQNRRAPEMWEGGI